MSKTIKQIADELGIDKQKVYRYIKKNHINETLQKSGVMYYDEATENLIKQAFSDTSASNESHQKHISDTVNEALVTMLQNELEIKNKQIEELNNRLAESHELINKAQNLHGADKALEHYKEQYLLEDEPKEPPTKEKKPSFLSRLFGNKDNENIKEVKEDEKSNVN